MRGAQRDKTPLFMPTRKRPTGPRKLLEAHVVVQRQLLVQQCRVLATAHPISPGQDSVEIELVVPYCGLLVLARTEESGNSVNMPS